MGIWSLIADEPQLVAVARKDGRKDESKRCGELARQRANVRGRRSQRGGVVEEEGGE